MNEMITLKINDNINHESFSIDVPPTYSGLDLKTEIEKQHLNLSANNMRLVYSGKLISDFYSLTHQKVKNNSIIYLISEKIKTTKKEEENQQEDIKNEHEFYDTLHILQVSLPVIRKRKIRLFLNTRILSLDSVFTTNTIYIFNGEILDKSESFEYYNIKNESTIIILPEDYTNENPSFLDKWIKKSSDTESFDNLRDSYANKSCKYESARLIDIKFNNIEMHRRKFINLYNAINFSSQNENRVCNNETNLIYNYETKPDSPSCEALKIDLKNE